MFHCLPELGELLHCVFKETACLMPPMRVAVMLHCIMDHGSYVIHP